MSTPVQKLLRLLSADQAVELRRAAALVLPEIAAKDEEVAQALQDALKDRKGAGGGAVGATEPSTRGDARRNAR